MTKIQKIQLRQSEIRQKINDLLGVEDRTAEQTVELEGLTSEAQAIEVEFRAALVAEPPDDATTATPAGDPEERERLELRSKARLTNYVSAAANGEAFDGAEAEYASAMGCRGGYMPVDMFMPEARERQQPEIRVVTPSVAAPGATAAIAPVLFQRTAASALGVQFPTVESGEANYPVLTTAPTAAVKAKDADAPSTAGAFRLDTRKPRRVTGQFTVRIEDLAVLPGMEESLRDAINDAVGDEVDAQIFNGSASDFATDGEIRGLFAQATDVGAAGSAETFASGVRRFSSLIDGQYANSMVDLRAIIGVDTFAAYAALFQSNGDVSLFDYLSGKLAGIRVSKRMPAKASNAQKGMVARTAGAQPIRVPVWRGVQLIRDDVYGDNAKKGLVTVTAYVLIGSPHLPYQTNTVVEIHPKLA